VFSLAVALTIRIISISSMIAPFQGYLVVAPIRQTHRHLTYYLTLSGLSGCGADNKNCQHLIYIFAPLGLPGCGADNKNCQHLIYIFAPLGLPGCG